MGREIRIAGLKAVQQQVVVLEQVRPQDVEALQGEGQGLVLLDQAQVRQPCQASQGLQVVVVDEVGTGYVEAVQEQGEELVVLEGQQLRLRTVGNSFVLQRPDIV